MDVGQAAKVHAALILASVLSVFSVVKLPVLHHRGHREHRGNAPEILRVLAS